METSFSPIYRKAIEIFTLTKYVSQYMAHDMSGLKKNGNEHPHIYLTGDMIQKSASLFPEIVRAETKKHPEEKHKHAKTLENLTTSLHKTCNKLEKSVSNSREFIQLLQSELTRFKKMQKTWSLSL